MKFLILIHFLHQDEDWFGRSGALRFGIITSGLPDLPAHSGPAYYPYLIYLTSLHEENAENSALYSNRNSFQDLVPSLLLINRPIIICYPGKCWKLQLLASMYLKSLENKYGTGYWGWWIKGHGLNLDEEVDSYERIFHDIAFNILVRTQRNNAKVMLGYLLEGWIKQ